MKTSREKSSSAPVRPSVYDWRSNDEQEVERRRLRGREEAFTVKKLEPERPIFFRFRLLPVLQLSL